MYVCICIYICMYIYIIHTHTAVYRYRCICTHTHTHTHTCTQKILVAVGRSREGGISRKVKRSWPVGNPHMARAYRLSGTVR